MPLRIIVLTALAAVAGWLPTVALAGSKPDSVTLSSSASATSLGQPLELTAQIMPPDATGNMTFFDDTTILGISIVQQGQAALTSSLLLSGRHALKAYYGGDSVYAGSMSPVVTMTVNALPGNGFAAPVSYPQGNQIVIADLNGDGHTDLVLVDLPDNLLRVLLGRGDGTFQLGVDLALPAANKPASLVVGDFNGDGHPDLALIQYYTTVGSTLNIFLGNGDGTFQSPVSQPVSSANWIADLAIGDFNGDGIADLAVMTLTSVELLLGNGDGTFQQKPGYSIPEAYSLAVGDFNGDGVADLVVVSYNSTTILLGNGDGTFTASATLSVGTGTMSVVDLNGDGIPDLVGGTYGSINIFLGNGDGTFRPLPPLMISCSGLAVGDFNGDGIPDLVISHSYSTHLVDVLPGNGDGTFQIPANLPIGLLAVEAPLIVVADFNGDGVADLAVLSGGVDILLGSQGQASTTALTSSSNPSTFGQSLTLTATVSPTQATGYVAFNDGATVVATVQISNGAAAFVTTSLNVGPHSLTAMYGGDATYAGSNSPALVQTVSQTTTSTSLTSSLNPAPSGRATTLTATVSPSLATGTITFLDGATTLGTLPLSSGLATLAINSFAPGLHSLTANYSGDANCIASTSPVLIEPSATAPSAPTTTTLATPVNGRSVVLSAAVSPADAAGSVIFYDGANMLGVRKLSRGTATFTTTLLPFGIRSIRAYYGGSAIYAPSSSTTAKITISTLPANMLSPAINYPLSGTPLSYVVADFNGDGVADIAALTNDSVDVLLGNGDGTFIPAMSSVAVQVSNASGFETMVTGDFNGDGNTDVAFTTASGVEVLLGNGDGTFQAPIVSVPGAPQLSIVAADFNGDGLTDLAVSDGQSLLILLSSGDGAFGVSQSLPGGVVDAAADFNGDGKADLALTTSVGVVVLLGKGDGTLTQSFGLRLFPPTEVATLAVGDFNADGKPDLVVGVYVSVPTESLANTKYLPAVTVFLGNGDGSFDEVQTTTYVENLGSILVGDFNGDGVADISTWGGVYLGKGNGTFGGAISNYVGSVVDLNGDGRPDIVSFSGTAGNPAVTVQLGEISGTSLGGNNSFDLYLP